MQCQMIKSYKVEDMVLFKILDKNDQTLEVFVNNEGFVMLEIEPEDNNDYYSYQSVILTREDASALMVELQRLLDNYEVKESE